MKTLNSILSNGFSYNTWKFVIARNNLKCLKASKENIKKQKVLATRITVAYYYKIIYYDLTETSLAFYLEVSILSN